MMHLRLQKIVPFPQLKVSDLMTEMSEFAKEILYRRGPKNLRLLQHTGKESSMNDVHFFSAVQKFFYSQNIPAKWGVEHN